MRLIKSFSEIIFPPSCLLCSNPGNDICHKCINQKLKIIHPSCYKCGRLTNKFSTCSSCKSSSDLNNVFVCFQYGEYAKEIINQFKFHNSAYLAKFIAVEISKIISISDTLITNIPTAPARIRLRGYDQSKLIAKELGRLNNQQYRELLIRLNNNKQVGSSAHKRKSQAKEFFASICPIPDKVLIIDDVLTTGATLEAAAKVLKQNGAKKAYAAVFAKV